MRYLVRVFHIYLSIYLSIYLYGRVLQDEGYHVGVPMIRIILFWGLYWVPLFRESTIYMCIYIFVLYFSIYIYIYVCVCIYVYVYIYSIGLERKFPSSLEWLGCKGFGFAVKWIRLGGLRFQV